MISARKIEIDPTVEQRKILERYCGLRRLVFNAALAEMTLRLEKQKESPKEEKPKISKEELKAKRQQAKEIRLIKQSEMKEARKERKQIGGRKAGVPTKPDDGKATWQNIRKTLLPKLRIEHPYLNDVSAYVLREAVVDVGMAFKHYWYKLQEGVPKKEAGKPKFKSKINTPPTFRMAQGDMIKVTATHILIPSARKGPEIGSIKLKRRGYIPTKNVRYSQVAFSKRAGRWFASVGVISDIEKTYDTQGPILGVDVGIRTLAAVSDGRLLGNKEDLKDLHQLELSLKRWQRRMSRRLEQAKKSEKKGSEGHLIYSQGFYEAKSKVQKLYYKITCVRQDLTHKITHEIVNSPASVIVLEDLNIKGMKKNRHLAPALQTVGLYEFRRQIEYKAKWLGKKVVFAHPYYPSYKRCSCCGKYNDNLGSSKVFHCPSCGFTCDRDLNAAYNLRDGYKQSLPDFLHGRSEQKAPRVEELQKEASCLASLMPNGTGVMQVVTLGLTDSSEGSDRLGNWAFEQSNETTSKIEKLVLDEQPEGLNFFPITHLSMDLSSTEVVDDLTPNKITNLSQRES
jgi:putative transposase